jgi:hypothetical protein
MHCEQTKDLAAASHDYDDSMAVGFFCMAYDIHL